MKNTFYLFALLLIELNCFGQHNTDKIIKPIVEEGKKLYKSEMASWYGTDLFLEKYKQQENIGGYLSYSENEISKCIFFSKGEKPKVLGTMTFDNTFSLQTAKTDVAEREFSKTESELYEIRENALKIMNSDTLFKQYQNTNLNLIPLISNGERKVYVLTGPQKNGVIIFGNDYLLTFNKKNNLISLKQLHKNIIVTNFGQKIDGNVTIGGSHTHLPETGDFMTSTDICTLMLYEKLTKWTQYSVVSKNYLSTWDFEKDELTAISMEALDKINKEEKKQQEKTN